MWEVMNSCVIIYNMIIQTEHAAPIIDDESYHRQGPLAAVDHQVLEEYAAFLAMRQEIQYADTNRQLQDDLVEHL